MSLPDTTKPADALEALSSPIALFGHVQSVEGSTTPAPGTCRAQVALRSSQILLLPVTLFTSEIRLQSLLETALSTGNLIEFHGTQRPNLLNSDLPSFASELPSVAQAFLRSYDIDRVNLFNHP